MPSLRDQVPARELGGRKPSVPGRWLGVGKPFGVRRAPVLAAADGAAVSLGILRTVADLLFPALLRHRFTFLEQECRTPN